MRRKAGDLYQGLIPDRNETEFAGIKQGMHGFAHFGPGHEGAKEGFEFRQVCRNHAIEILR